MEAARVASLRGHEVILYEKERKLGGQLPLAALIKGLEIEDQSALIGYLMANITAQGVKIRTGVQFDDSAIEQIKPDVVILATGGIPFTPEIPGLNKKNVLAGSDLYRMVKFPLRVLGPKFLNWLTKLWMPIGKRVVIVGGAIHGCELAEFLVKRKRIVTIVEESMELGSGMVSINKTRLLEWLNKKGVTMLTDVKYEKILDEGLVVITKEGNRHTVETDTIILATGFSPNSEMVKPLTGKVPEVHLIGDCKKPGLIIDAIHDGSILGRAV
jgi:2,4-dienoyl-CoA reductase (NADPH2)